MAYHIITTKTADKQFEKILKSAPNHAEHITAVIDKIKSLDNPFVWNCKKMQGVDNQYRWRAGEYRIIGEVIKDRLIIKLIRIANRSRAYKD